MPGSKGDPNLGTHWLQRIFQLFDLSPSVSKGLGFGLQEQSGGRRREDGPGLLLCFGFQGSGLC